MVYLGRVWVLVKQVVVIVAPKDDDGRKCSPGLDTCDGNERQVVTDVERPFFNLAYCKAQYHKEG